MKTFFKGVVVVGAAVMFGASIAILVGVRVQDDMADVSSAIMETLGPAPVVQPDGGDDE